MGIRKMSIQEGLNELKTLDARISQGMYRKNYGIIITGQRVVPGYDSNEKFIEETKSSYQSVVALIKRRTLIKNAIIRKNAEVEVEIGDKVMTLAEAINHKSYIKADKDLLAQLTNQYNSLMSSFSNSYNHYQIKLDSYIEQIVGKDQKDKMKANEEILKFFKQENEPKLIDPIGLKSVIEQMTKEIGEFEARVDFVLTRANITNDIEFEDSTVE